MVAAIFFLCYLLQWCPKATRSPLSIATVSLGTTICHHVSQLIHNAPDFCPLEFSVHQTFLANFSLLFYLTLFHEQQRNAVCILMCDSVISQIFQLLLKDLSLLFPRLAAGVRIHVWEKNTPWNSDSSLPSVAHGFGTWPSLSINFWWPNYQLTQCVWFPAVDTAENQAEVSHTIILLSSH